VSHGDNGEYAQRERARRLGRFGRENLAVTESSRLAATLGGLSLATDLVAGLPSETALRTATLAGQIGRELGLTASAVSDVFYAALLRFVGCSAFAHETAALGGGQDQALLRSLTPTDAARPRSVFLHAGRGMGRRRARVLVNVVTHPSTPLALARAHCDLATQLAARLGASENVVTALGQIFERWDGKGAPNGLRGDALSLTARVLHAAFRAETHRALLGTEQASEVVRERRGSELEPRVADACSRALSVSFTGKSSVWQRFLEAEPAPFRRFEATDTERVALAFAHYVDLKSPYTLGHSTQVAALARRVATELGLPPREQDELGHAALLHDLGKVGVPNGVLDKPGPLDVHEWDQVRQHAHDTRRILERAPTLAPLALLAASDHERLDGQGYPRSAPASALSAAARVLAACDSFSAMREERAYRPALSEADARQELTAAARAGRLDLRSVEALLATTGARSRKVARAWPAGLTDREVEVLTLVARGLSNKEVGRRLFISPRTVQHHLEHAFEKTGARSRAALAVYVVSHDLVEK